MQTTKPNSLTHCWTGLQSDAQTNHILLCCMLSQLSIEYAEETCLLRPLSVNVVCLDAALYPASTIPTAVQPKYIIHLLLQCLAW